MNKDDVSISDDISCFLLYDLIRKKDLRSVVVIHCLAEDLLRLKDGRGYGGGGDG